MSNTEHSIEIPEGLPTTVEGFLALRDRIATTPQGGLAAYVVAQAVYAADPELGMKLLTIASDRSLLTSSPDGYKGFTLSRMEAATIKERIGSKPYLARSYFRGTSPENGYTLPSGGLTVAVRHQEMDKIEDTAKMFVHSTGADSPRPVQLVQNNKGLWKAKNVSSLQVGCRPPVVEVDDDL